MLLFFCGLCIALPLGLMKSLEVLGFIGYFSLIFYAIFVLVMFKISISEGFLNLQWLANAKLWDISGLFQCIPIFSLAYGCHWQLFVVYDSLEDSSTIRMNNIVKSSLKIVTFVYSTVAVFGYATFLNTVEGNVLKNLPSTTLLQLIKMGFAASVVVGFPLMIFPCRQSIYTLFFKQQRPSDSIASKTFIEPFTFKTLTLGIVFFTMSVAIFIPNVETILGLTGATMGSLVYFILPSIIFMKADYSSSKKIPKIVFVVGCILFVVCTYSNVYPVENLQTISPQNNLEQSKVNMVLNLKEKEILNSQNNKKAAPVILKEQEHRHEPVNPEPPIIDVNKNKENLANSIQNVNKENSLVHDLLPIVDTANAENNVMVSDKKPQLHKKSKVTLENVEKPYVKKIDANKQSQDINSKDHKIKPIQAEISEEKDNLEINESLVEAKADRLKKDVLAKSLKKENQEKAVEALVKEIKDTNEVQSKLLAKQKELLDVLVKNKIENEKPINDKNLLLNDSNAKNVEVSQQLQISNDKDRKSNDHVLLEGVDESHNQIKPQSPLKQSEEKEPVVQKDKSKIIPEQTVDETILNQDNSEQLKFQNTPAPAEKESLKLKNHSLSNNTVNLNVKKVVKPISKESKDLPQDLR